MRKKILRVALLCLFLCVVSVATVRAQQNETLSESALVANALQEIDLSLDAYFQLIDDEDLLLFVTAVSHAARGRLLLEQYLGEDVDSLSSKLLVKDPIRFDLVLVAKYAKLFTGEEAREMWRRDHAFDSFENAKQKLAEWDVHVKALKKQLQSVQ